MSTPGSLPRRALLLVASLAAFPEAARAAPPAQAEPTLEQRLARLCEDLEQRRQDLHISGLSLAVVKDDQVVLARGFGLRDREQKLPADEQTLYGIGSTSKAFTSMLVAMLADEGKMSFAESPKKYLPWFRLKDPAADAQMTVRDLLVHRTGLTRTDVAWFGTSATREELLRQVAEAEGFQPFRKAWQYNNTMLLCAGECAAAVAGESFDQLLKERIFTPLQMTRSGSLAQHALADPRRALGYDWDAKKGEFKKLEFLPIDNIGPAGSINSTVLDMANWVRFLLKRGTFDGKRLVADAQFDELWKDDDDLAPSYGPGWFLHDNDGQQWTAPDGTKHRVVEHGGNIVGYAAEVGLLPDRQLGLVLLTNTSATQLQQGILRMVWDALLGPFKERQPVAEGKALAEGETSGWLGTYKEEKSWIVNPASLGRSGDHLLLVIPPALSRPAAEIYTLLWPVEGDRYRLREDPDSYVTFQGDGGKGLASLTLVQGEATRKMVLVRRPDGTRGADLTVEELMAARAEAHVVVPDTWKTLRCSGTMRFVHGGVSGRVTLLAQGSDRLRVEYDAGKFGRSFVVIDGARGIAASQTTGTQSLTPAECAQLLLGSPLVEAGNWLDHAQDVEILKITRTLEAGGQIGAECYAVRVTPFDGEPVTLYLSKASLLLAAIEGPTAFMSVALGLPIGLAGDVKEIEGVKLPLRRELTVPESGRMVLQIDKVEPNVELPADSFTFTAPPAAGS